MSDAINDCNRNSLATNTSVSVINDTMTVGIMKIARKALGISVLFITVIIYPLVRILNLYRPGHWILKTFVRYLQLFFLESGY